jgi:hypothetical protein
VWINSSVATQMWATIKISQQWLCYAGDTLTFLGLLFQI